MESTLEDLLAHADWRAVDEAARIGQAAWPVIKRGTEMSETLSRQISMVCAGRLGGDEAGPVLLAGLSDRHVNVRLAAAGQLSASPPASAQDGMLDALAEGEDEEACELLALGAGYFPDERTVKVLQNITDGEDELAENARLALARLGDDSSREAYVEQLTSDEPVERYQALELLPYVNEPNLASHAVGLLADKEDAQPIGHEYNIRYRRVCDQAVDSLVQLLDLKPEFGVSPEKIYSDQELKTTAELAR